ncbi:hypothetical protein QR98_0042030 [Sarcoptes scabiei]|uniref:Uncharacterized protein n=1 Tax=Sarcoptes scabiei TaxID=52283 RepID=A0A132A489_SARSC|nr:hypothetical protein QR98_0042030 [Sarcoptes scabiei]
MSGSTNLLFSKRAVEVTFSSIDDLRLRLIRLRESRSETIQLSSDHMEYMQTIEEDLDDLKTLVNAISSSLWRKILLTRANHGDLEDLTAHYREFRSECHRSHIARLELIRQIEVLRQMETGLLATVRFYHRAFEQTYDWLFAFQRIANRVENRELI